jgi:hypothetical protein
MEKFRKQEIEITNADYESKRFKKNICKIMIPNNHKQQKVARLIKEQLKINDMVFLSNCDENLDLIREFHSNKIQYQELEPLIYYKFLELRSQDTRSRIEFEEVTEKKIDEFKNNVYKIFKGYRNYYDKNRQLKKVDIAEVYSEWSESIVNNSMYQGLNAMEEGENIGIVMFEINEHEINILLAGIAPKHQKQGKYNLMISNFIVNYCLKKEVYISTQISNLTVQKCWIRNGFEPSLIIERFHCWNNK